MFFLRMWFSGKLGFLCPCKGYRYPHFCYSPCVCASVCVCLCLQTFVTCVSQWQCVCACTPRIYWQPRTVTAALQWQPASLQVACATKQCHKSLKLLVSLQLEVQVAFQVAVSVHVEAWNTNSEFNFKHSGVNWMWVQCTGTVRVVTCMVSLIVLDILLLAICHWVLWWHPPYFRKRCIACGLGPTACSTVSTNNLSVADFWMKRRELEP